MADLLYKNSRDVFLDTVEVKDYIQIHRISAVYESISKSIKKPLKMILLYGQPGTGKSMFLSKLYEDFSSVQKAHLYKTPMLNENEFLKRLAKDMYGIEQTVDTDLTDFIDLLQNKEADEIPVPLIFLDEAQLYSDSMMETIRLLSDTRKIKFIISLHKTQKEDIIAKEHFRTRIWESIRLQNASAEELMIYVQKKLLKANCVESANMFTKSSMDFIHKLTQGNFRETNKLLYTLFDIYDYYMQKNSKKVDKEKISKKIIEMSAIHTGLIDA